MASLRILRPGLLTTVQDCGRWGHQAQGVPVAGAMDTYSHRLANHVAGNTFDAATLEVTLTGPQVEFVEATRFAVCGAEFRLAVDGSPVPMNEAIEVAPGSCLRFGDRIRGARAYLAVAGGIDVPCALGSRATHVVSRMGGLDGRALRAGDVLPVGPEKGVRPLLQVKGAVPLFPVLPGGGARVRVIAGALMDRLAGRRFTISSQSNRMGYRLDAPYQDAAAASGEVISGPVPTGAVQVPPGAQPILLMADHGSSGGYAVAATVITADLPLAGQLAPGDWIEFEACSLKDADDALRAAEAWVAGERA
jgi:antagonist of KipI